MNQQKFKLRLDTPTSYRIRLQGVLGKSWSDHMYGMTIEINQRPGKAPITTLTGKVTDQAALHGLLNSVYDLGFPLLSVECVDELRHKEEGNCDKIA